MRIMDFEVYKDLLQEKSGLILQQDQSYLLDSRLMPIAKKWGFSSLEALTTTLHGVPDRDLVSDVVEAMVMKDTSFFRDTWPFRLLEDNILPLLKKSRKGKKRLKIWCAGGSTGQEAYSLALLLRKNESDFPGWKMDILSTDISADSLEQAKLGIYSQFEAQRGLPVRMLLKYFRQSGETNWQINPDIRHMVTHQHFNLLDNMSGLGHFDIILCRNVLDNFDPALRKKTLEKLVKQLEKDGFLLLGRGENADSGTLRPYHEKCGLYIPKDSPHKTLSVGNAQPLAKSAV